MASRQHVPNLDRWVTLIQRSASPDLDAWNQPIPGEPVETGLWAQRMDVTVSDQLPMGHLGLIEVKYRRYIIRDRDGVKAGEDRIRDDGLVGNILGSAEYPPDVRGRYRELFVQFAE